MIEWLNSWLKGLIGVVLLAAFVDLLLPSGTFQRYVRTVLGLFILLTMLTPVLSLFRQPWDVNKLLASSEQTTMRAGAGAGGLTQAAMKPLSSIMQDAERWQRDNRQEAQRVLERQLAMELQRSLAEGERVRVRQVSLEMTYDNNGEPALQSLRVTLDHTEAVPASAGLPPQHAGIAEIEPVRIEVRVGADRHLLDKGAEPPETPEQMAVKQRLYAHIHREWRLDRSQVTLVWETQSGKGG